MAQVKLQNVGHSYLSNPKGVEDYAVRPLEMTWEDGGAYALLGPSGCGKTTLGRSLVRLVEKSSGKVIFKGKDNLTTED